MTATSAVIGYVPGAWDMFRIGHLNILLCARAQCDRLIVGVVTDEILVSAKGKFPVVPLQERLDVVAAVDLVDEVVVDQSSDKPVAWEQQRFDVIVKGDDWRGTPKGDRLEKTTAQVGASV